MFHLLLIFLNLLFLLLNLLLLLFHSVFNNLLERIDDCLLINPFQFRFLFLSLVFNLFSISFQIVHLSFHFFHFRRNWWCGFINSVLDVLDKALPFLTLITLILNWPSQYYIAREIFVVIKVRSIEVSFYFLDKLSFYFVGLCNHFLHDFSIRLWNYSYNEIEQDNVQKENCRDPNYPGKNYMSVIELRKIVSLEVASWSSESHNKVPEVAYTVIVCVWIWCLNLK